MSTLSMPGQSSVHSPASTLTEAVRNRLGTQLATITVQLDLLDRGQADAETIHDLRVAGRRSTSLARLAQPFLAKGWSGDIIEVLRPIRKATNLLRDGDVLLARLDDWRAKTDDGDFAALDEIKIRVQAERDQALSRVLHKLSDKSFRKALTGLRDELSLPDSALNWLRLSRNQADQADLFKLGDIRLAFLGSLTAELLRLRRMTPSAAELPLDIRNDPALLAGFLDVPAPLVHEIRLAIKDLRYGLEFLRPVLNRRVTTQAIRKFRTMQSQLGTIHDLDLAMGKWQTLTDAMDAEAVQAREVLTQLNSAWLLERQTLLNQFLKSWVGIKQAGLDNLVIKLMTIPPQ